MVASPVKFGLGALLVLAACHRSEPSTVTPAEAGSNAPQAGPMWLDQVPSFPAAREVGSQHVSGTGSEGPLHIICHLYATASAPEEVVAFYAARISGANAAADRSSLKARAGNVDVAVHPANGSDYPRCGATLAPSDRTVILLSQAIR